MKKNNPAGASRPGKTAPFTTKKAHKDYTDGPGTKPVKTAGGNTFWRAKPVKGGHH